MTRNGIVVCDNGEPDPMGYRYFGTFDGPDHARLWEQTLHRRGGRPCPFHHWIETLEKPTMLSMVESPSDERVPPHPFVAEQRSNLCLLFVEGGTCCLPPDDPIHTSRRVPESEERPVCRRFRHDEHCIDEPHA